MKRIVFFLLLLVSSVYGQEKKFTVSGVVTDCKTKGLIMDVVLKLVGSDGSSIETLTDSSGYYSFDSKKINQNREYVITASVTSNSIVKGSKNKRGYLSSSDKCKFNTRDSTSKAFSFDFCLVKGGCDMQLPLYYFEKNNSNNGVKDENTFDMDMLYQYMEDNPTIVVEIGGHSSNDEKKPEILAKKRAETIKMFLVGMGVDAERLVVKSYSNKKPFELFDEETGEITLADKNDAASYKLNRRVVINIIRKDYIPKQK